MCSTVYLSVSEGPALDSTNMPYPIGGNNSALSRLKASITKCYKKAFYLLISSVRITVKQSKPITQYNTCTSAGNHDLDEKAKQSVAMIQQYTMQKLYK